MHLITFENPDNPKTQAAVLVDIHLSSKQVLLFCAKDRVAVCNIALTHGEVRQLLLACLDELADMAD